MSQDLNNWFEVIEAIIGERLQCLLWWVQIVEQHVKRVERLEEVIKANEFDIFQIYVHQLSIPLALFFGSTQMAITTCLDFCYKEEGIEVRILLDLERIEICTDSADQTRIHEWLQVELTARD